MLFMCNGSRFEDENEDDDENELLNEKVKRI